MKSIMGRRKSPNKSRVNRNKSASRSSIVIRVCFILLVILLVIAYLSFKNWEKKQNNRLESASKLVHTSMGTIEYISIGEGPIILFSHMGGSGYDNVFLFEELTKAGFRIICPSRPGYLRTPLSDNANFSYQADLFAELLQSLNIKEKVIVMGYSFGGPAAIEFAMNYPRKTKGLILHSAITKKFTSEGDLEENSKFLSLMLSDIWQDLLCWGYSISTNVFPKRVVGEILERGSTFDKNYCKAATAELIQDENTILLLKKFEASTVPLSRRSDGLSNDLKWAELYEPNLNRLRIPILVTHSKNDKIVNVSHAQEFKKIENWADVFLYEGYGHAIFFGEAWSKLIDRTKTFINKQYKNPSPLANKFNLINNTWVNKEDGSLLSFNEDKSFSLDFPSVDSDRNISGIFEINKNILSLTFNETGGYCNDKTAQYRFEINNQDLKLKVKNDNCKRRKSQFTAGWFLL